MSNIAESYNIGRCKVEIHYDYDCEHANPRDYDNLGIMVNWHDRYNLGDVQGREEYGDGDAFLRHLANDYAPPRRDYENSEMEKVWNVVQKHYVILPLCLYDHSGISIFVGGRGSLPWDSAGWDTSNIGYIYCSLEAARKNWMLPKRAGWKTKIDWQNYSKMKVDSVGKIVTPTKLEKRRITLEEATSKVLEGEVEHYDEFLTGQVFGYVVEAENGEEESCWGFVGDIDYVKSEAYDVAVRLNEQMDEEDRVAAKTELETALAETMP